jgi:hypothetical protein
VKQLFSDEKKTKLKNKNKKARERRRKEVEKCGGHSNVNKK